MATATTTRLEVTVSGEVDPVSGFVVDLKKLKDLMNREVVDVYDHRHLNHEVPEFAQRIPTAEISRSASGSAWKNHCVRSCPGQNYIAFVCMRWPTCLRIITAR